MSEQLKKEPDEINQEEIKPEEIKPKKKTGAPAVVEGSLVTELEKKIAALIDEKDGLIKRQKETEDYLTEVREFLKAKPATVTNRKNLLEELEAFYASFFEFGKK